MSVNITEKQNNAFSTCYGSDPCDDLKVSQSTIDFIREKILGKNTNSQSESQPTRVDNIISRWKSDSEQYSSNLKL